MIIYNRYANLLLELHRVFHELVLWEFDKKEDFNTQYWEEKLDPELQGKIEYKYYSSETNAKKITIRPAYKIHTSTKYGDFYIEYRSYSGKVAKNVYDKLVRVISSIKEEKDDTIRLSKLKELVMENGEFWIAKQSVFDFYFSTGNRYFKLYGGDATHFNLFKDLKNYSNYVNCLRVWRGDDIFGEIVDEDEKDALFTLSCLMFEQDINYGKSAFQQDTNFRIDEKFKLHHRSRDMIMGFVNMLFSDETLYNSYPYWVKDKGYPDFGPGYKVLDVKYKKYFTEYNNAVKYKDVLPLMDDNGVYLKQFKDFARVAKRNPYLNGFTI